MARKSYVVGEVDDDKMHKYICFSESEAEYNHLRRMIRGSDEGMAYNVSEV